MKNLARRRPLAGALIVGLALFSLWLVTSREPPARRREKVSLPLRELRLEQGRRFLLTGDTERALAYLAEAYRGAEDDVGLAFLVARAVDALPDESVPEGLRQPKGVRSVKLEPATDAPSQRWTSADFAPDWTRVVAVDAVGTAAIFDFEDGRRLLALDGAPAAVVLVGFSPDGAMVAGLHPDGRFSLWESVTGTLRRTSGAALRASGEGNAPMAMAFSPDGRRLAVAGPDAHVRITATESGARLTVFESGPVVAAAFHPEGRRLVTAGGRGVLVWDAETGAPVVSPDPPRQEAAVTRVSYSPDGRSILAAGNRPEVRLFHAATGDLEAWLPGPRSPTRRAVFSPGGELVLALGDDGAARVWDAERGRLLALFVLPASEVIHVAYGPRTERFATVHADGTIAVRSVPLDERGAAEIERLRRCVAPWRLASGRLVPARTDPRYCTEIRPADLTPDVPRRLTRTTPHPGTSKALPLPFELRTVVTGQVVDLHGAPIAGAEIRVWAEGEPLLVLRHEAAVKSASFSSDGRHVMVGTADGTARVWDLGTRRPVTAPIEGEVVLGAAPFSMNPDGTLVATAAWDTVRIWEVGKGRSRGPPLRHPASVASMAFSPDGRRLLTTSTGDGAVRIWQVPGASSDAEAMAALVEPVAESGEDGRLRFEVDRVGPRRKLLVSRAGYRTPAVHLLPAHREHLAFRAELSDRGGPSRIAAVETPGSAPPEHYVVLRDADLVETLRSLARILGGSFVFSPEVRGRVRAELPGVPPAEVLERILSAYRLRSETVGNLTIVLPEDGRRLAAESDVLRGGHVLQGSSRLPSGALISMSLKNADLVATLGSLATIAGVELAIDPEISTPVSIEIERVAWDRALVELLRLYDLELEASAVRWKIRRLDRGVP